VGGDCVVRVYDFTPGHPGDTHANTYDDDVDPARCQPVDGRGAHAPPRNLMTRTAQEGRARFYFGHEKQISDVVFDPAGALVTVSADGTLRQWPAQVVPPGVRIGHFETSYPLYHPAASVDGLGVLYLDRQYSRLCDVPLSRASGHNVTLSMGGWQAPLAALRDGRVLTQDRNTGEVVVWVREGGQMREQKRLIETGKAPNTGTGRTRRGVLSGDEQRLVGAYEGRLFTVDIAKGTVTWSGDLGLKAGQYLGLGVTRYANHDLSPDGQCIATSDFGPRITIHRFTEPGKIVAILGGHARDNDTAVAFSRDGRRLFTGNEDGRIRVWDTATWRELPEFGWPAHRSAVTALAVSNDGTLIASSGGDTLKLFPTLPETGHPQPRERLSFQLDQPANWIQFARDGQGRDRALLHSVPGGTLQVWETDEAVDQESPPGP
jgi:WD40 repeat protein